MFLLDDESVDCEREVTGSKASLTYASEVSDKGDDEGCEEDLAAKTG